MTPKRAYPENPLVGVGTVVFGARILMIKRTAPPRQHEWSFPAVCRMGETVFRPPFGKPWRKPASGSGSREAGVVDGVDRDAEAAFVHYTIIDVWEQEAGEPTPGATP